MADLKLLLQRPSDGAVEGRKLREPRALALLVPAGGAAMVRRSVADRSRDHPAERRTWLDLESLKTLCSGRRRVRMRITWLAAPRAVNCLTGPSNSHARHSALSQRHSTGTQAQLALSPPMSPSALSCPEEPPRRESPSRFRASGSIDATWRWMSCRALVKD